MSTTETLVYHFEPAYKFYLGSEPAHLSPTTGTPLLPFSATFKRPPILETNAAEIACFDTQSDEWVIRENKFWRPTVRECNYDAGRRMATYKPLRLSPYRDFPAYPSIPMICSGAIVALNISERIHYIHDKFETICLLHRTIMAGEVKPPSRIQIGDVFAPHMQYKLEVEALVYHMRRVLDSLTQLTFLITNNEEFETTRAISKNEIGLVAAVQSPKSDFEKILIGDGKDYKNDSTGFIPIINGLFNSFKHCLMHEESCMVMGIDSPTIVSYHAKYNDHNNEITHHNHNAFHIMMGFQDTATRIIENQKVYLQKRSA